MQGPGFLNHSALFREYCLITIAKPVNASKCYTMCSADSLLLLSLHPPPLLLLLSLLPLLLLLRAVYNITFLPR